MLYRWYYDEKFHFQRVACYCYQKIRHTKFFKKNLRQMFLNGCFKARNSTRKTLTLRQSPSNKMLQNKNVTGGIAGNLAYRSLQVNMHKLFVCLRTPLESLTFHSKTCKFCFINMHNFLFLKHKL